MTLVVLTVVVIGVLVAVLAIYLFAIGVQLNRTAVNLSDCLQNVRTIAGQAQVIGPGVKRINKTGGDLLGAMPLLIEGAEAVTAKVAPSTAVPTAPNVAAPEPVQVGGDYLDSPRGTVGYMDAAPTVSAATAPEPVQVGGGYLDSPRGTVGYMDE